MSDVTTKILWKEENKVKPFKDSLSILGILFGTEFSTGETVKVPTKLWVIRELRRNTLGPTPV